MPPHDGGSRPKSRHSERRLKGTMPYTFLDDIATADVAFEATGGNLEELFKEASEATLATMIEEPDSVKPRTERWIELENPELDLLLFDLLQELIFYKDAERLLLRVIQIEVHGGGCGFSLRALARGEKLDPDRHQQCADVKAVTLHDFIVEKTLRGWRSLVILDV